MNQTYRDALAWQAAEMLRQAKAAQAKDKPADKDDEDKTPVVNVPALPAWACRWSPGCPGCGE